MSNHSKWNWSKDKAKHYKDAEYVSNRKVVLNRDLGMCIRCWTITGKIVQFHSCDHFRHINSDGKPDHSLKNLWLLCHQCHLRKTTLEANGYGSVTAPFGDADRDDEGWPLGIDWQTIIDARNREFLGL